MKSLKELMNLQGRVALVTGAGGHIGGAICETLAELGAEIVILDAEEKSARNVAERIHHACKVGAVPLVVDVTDEDEVRAVPAMVMNRFGRMDILVNCAALVGTSELKGWATPFTEQSSDTWRLALETNLTAPFVLTQACAEVLANSGHGSVINVGSIYGMLGPDMSLYENTQLDNPAAYAASKGGLLQMTRWLATVLAPDVRVNAISPGGVWRNQPKVFHDRYAARTPLKRMAVEEDLKGAVAYLASDLSAYVTGHNLVVDGGWTIW
ncbi:MAG: SDR family oxidoreductase [Anaerolineaceae bacterium]|nr:MAG: SDR family oxidoreductase [Anaerolineaceae bacterium]